MEQENPLLYNFYTDQKTVDDLYRMVDQNLPNYISSIKHGKKYEQEVRDAVYNLVSGIKDKTITFGNGRYNDSLGRYNNNKNKNKDVYGWAANFVYNQMKDQKKYEVPSTKQKWDNNIMSSTLLKGIFGEGTPNYEYFVEQDPYNEDTKTRDTTVRSSMLADLIDNTFNDNFFNQYEGQSDTDRAQRLQLAKEASQKLRDGFNPSDLLFLAKAFPNIQWDRLFRTSQSGASQQQQQSLTIQGLADYANQYSPRVNGDTADISLNYTDNLGEDTSIRLASFIQSMDTNDLYGNLMLAIKNPEYNFTRESPDFYQAIGGKADVSSQFITRKIIQELNRRGKLIKDNSNQNILYIPELTDNDTNSGFYYDSSSKILHKRNLRDLPYGQKQLWAGYSEQQTGEHPGRVESWMSQFFTNPQFNKQGGVLKAQRGIKFSNKANWYTGVFTPQLNHILEGLKKDQNYYQWLNSMQDKHYRLYSHAGTDWQNTAYGDASVGAYQNEYKLGYNGEWESSPSGYNSLGIQNAINNDMFDVSGGTRTSGDWSDAGFKTDNLYSAITDYRRLLGREGDYTPEQLEATRNLLREAGYDIYLDTNGYYKLRLREGPQAPKEPGLIVPEADLPDKLPIGSSSTRKSYIDRRNPEGKKSKDRDFSTALADFVPEGLAIGRLWASLRTNNRVARELRKSLRPVLKDTYERYSPITGAFGEMQMMNQQAADLRRQAARPFTSDASLQLAGQLEANKQARRLEQAGFLADDKAIDKSKQAALERQEDNMARRSDVANFNRASINQTNRERSQLEATRLKRNWQSLDNYLQGLETRLRTNLTQREQQEQAASMMAAQNIYQQSLQTYNDNYKANHKDATYQDMLNDPKYVEGVQDLRRRYQYDMYNIGRGIYLKDPYRNNIPRTYDEILSARQGGILKPSIMHLINKVIENESYT